MNVNTLKIREEKCLLSVANSVKLSIETEEEVSCALGMLRPWRVFYYHKPTELLEENVSKGTTRLWQISGSKNDCSKNYAYT